MLTVKDVTGRRPDPRSVVPGLGLSNTLFGIELEIENVRERLPCDWWVWVDDGSLRNNGAELILSTPTGGKDLESALIAFSELLTRIADEQGSPPEITERCSVHTHMDFRSCTMEQVYSFFLGFCLFESALFTVGGKDRYSSIYCPGLSSCRPQIRMFNKLLKSSNQEQVARILREWPKYTALNLGSLMSHGSIEVRLHKGTTSVDDIVLWVRILDKLKQFTDSISPEALVKLAQDRGVSLAGTVFQELSSHIMTDNYRNFFDNNLRNALDCLHWDVIEGLHKPDLGDAKKYADAIIAFLE